MTDTDLTPSWTTYDDLCTAIGALRYTAKRLRELGGTPTTEDAAVERLTVVAARMRAELTPRPAVICEAQS